MLGDILPYEHYTYDVILCFPNKDEISMLDVVNLDLDKRFNGIDELSVELLYYENGYTKTVNNDFHKILGDYLLKLNTKIGDEVISSKYFTIDLPSENYVDIDKKSIHAYSAEYLWGKRRLRGYKDVRKLYDGQVYDYVDNTKGGLLDYIIQVKFLNTYSVSYINPTLLNNYRSWDFPDDSLIEVIKKIEEAYSCIIQFDTVNNTLSIDYVTNIGENTGLVISDHYLKNIKKENKNDQIITQLNIYGKNGLGINGVNVTGQAYLLDLTHYRTLDYMDQPLLDAWTAYDAVLTTQEGLFATYLTQLAGFEATLLTKQNELVALNTTLEIYEQNEDICIRFGIADGHDYTYWHNLWKSQKTAIATKQSEIDAVELQIDGVNANIATVNTTVSLQSNFTAQQLEDMLPYFKEDSITLDLIDDEETLLEEGQYQLSIKSQPPTDFTIDSVSFLDTIEGQLDWEKINLGDFINIQYDKMLIAATPLPLRLVAYRHNPFQNSLELSFSTLNVLNTDFLYMNDIYARPNRFANTLEVERPDYNEYQDDKDDILTDTSDIDTSNNNILFGDGSVVDRRGQYMRDNVSALGQMRILGDRIVFTEDNWETISVGIWSGGIVTSSLFTLTNTGGSVEINDNTINITNMNLTLTTLDGLQQIKIDPTVGISISVWDSIGGIWDDRFYVDTGVLIHRGLFTTGKTGEARIEIDDNGLVSYNSSNQKHGLEINPGAFVDVIVYRSGVEIFKVYDDITIIDLYALGDIFLSSAGATSYPNGAWNCIYGEFTNLSDGSNPYVTTAWAAQKGVNTDSDSHSHTVVVGGVTYTTSSESHNHGQN